MNTNTFTPEEQTRILKAVHSYVESAVANEGKECELVETPYAEIAIYAINSARLADFGDN